MTNAEALQKQFGSKYIQESEKAVELLAFEKILKNQAKLIEKYEELYYGDISTDIALRFFIPDGYEGTNSNVFHKPSVFLNNLIFERYISNKKGIGKVVFFTAGGTGAGKTSSLKALDRSEVAFSYDSNLAVFDTAVKKIDAVLEAGYEVFVAYVHRPAVNAFAEGVVKRALSFLDDGEPPRTVPIPAHVKTHVQCPLVALQIYEHYSGHPKLNLVVYDNSYKEGEAAVVSIPFLEGQLYTKEAQELLTQKLYAIADEKFKKNEISDKIYKSFIDKR